MYGDCIDVESVYFVDLSLLFFFLMIRRPPRSTLDRSSAASDVYKRQIYGLLAQLYYSAPTPDLLASLRVAPTEAPAAGGFLEEPWREPVSYTHLRAHETVLDLVCRLLLEIKPTNISEAQTCVH